MSTASHTRQQGQEVYRRSVGLLSFTHLFDYLYCMLASTVLVGQPLPGGALYMVAHISLLAAQILHPDKLRYLNRRYRIIGIILTTLAAIISLLLLLVYPRSVDLPQLWILFGVVLTVKLREEISKRINQLCLRKMLRPIQRILRLAETGILFLILISPLLFFSLQTDTAWYLLGGFTLTSIISGYTVCQLPQKIILDNTQSGSNPVPEELKHINALQSYHSVSAITLTALQVTMIFSYTLIAVSAGDLLLCMGIAFVSTYIPSNMVTRVLRSPRNQLRDPSNLLMLGLILWLGSLMMLWRNLSSLNSLGAFVSLAFCTAGCAIASVSLKALDQSMGDVIRFVTGSQSDELKDALQDVQTAFANLFGQMVALIGLGLLLFFGGEEGIPSSLDLQPALLIPALTLVAAALLAAFRFPMDKQSAKKLHRFLMLKETGETNIALQLQLETLLVKVYRRH